MLEDLNSNDALNWLLKVLNELEFNFYLVLLASKYKKKICVICITILKKNDDCEEYNQQIFTDKMSKEALWTDSDILKEFLAKQ